MSALQSCSCTVSGNRELRPDSEPKDWKADAIHSYLSFFAIFAFFAVNSTPQFRLVRGPTHCLPSANY